MAKSQPVFFLAIFAITPYIVAVDGNNQPDILSGIFYFKNEFLFHMILAYSTFFLKKLSTYLALSFNEILTKHQHMWGVFASINNYFAIILLRDRIKT